MRLGELIELLETQPAERPVRYSDGSIPGRFASWRGVYAQLTLAPTGTRVTAGDLLDRARNADGGTFKGRKGGDYRMGRDSPVWADSEGDCDYWAITGWSVAADEALLLTRTNVADYRDW